MKIELENSPIYFHFLIGTSIYKALERQFHLLRMSGGPSSNWRTLANSLLDRAERARWGSSLLIEGFTSDFAIFLPCSGSKLARHLPQSR